MFPAARLKFLQQRKQELLNASEVNRRLLTLECAATEQRLEWFDRTVRVARRLKPFIGLAVPLVGALAAQRGNRERSWIGAIASALPMAGRFASAVQQFIHR
jgi:hypothetical protein